MYLRHPFGWRRIVETVSLEAVKRTLQWSLCIAAATAITTQAGTTSPTKTANDLNNPHQGFMLWGSDYADGAPANHYGATLFHVYMPWREIETSDQVFDWSAFEANHLQPILNDYSNATFVLRPVADYPDGANSGITGFYTGGELERDYPKFLEQAPLNIAFTDYADCDGDGPGRTPDWDNPAMVTQMTQFITAIADHFDGDPRITCIQTGLLGLWGEWHQSGCPNAAPGTSTKETLRDHYAAAFTQTLLQTRYPRDPDAVGVEFGFHEDYFPSFTAPCVYGFPQCSDSGDWSLDYCYRNVTPASTNNWETNPVSGESPLGSQKNTWVNDTADILTVLRDYHFSFLGPAGKHEQNGHAPTMQQIKRALGYNYHIERFDWQDDIENSLPFDVTVVWTNSGAAPCYTPFPVELSLCGAGSNPVWATHMTFDLRDVTPGQPWTNSAPFAISGVDTGTYDICLAIIDPRFPNQPGVRIQSAGEDASLRTHLGSVQVLPQNAVDTDSDDLPDRWELDNTGSTTNTPTGDLDGDGASNQHEFIAGTHPSNQLDFAQLHIQHNNGAAIIRLPTRAAEGIGNRLYSLESTTNPITTIYSGIANWTNILGTNQVLEWTNSPAHPADLIRARIWID